jgi:hypothetical protein
VVRSKHSPFRIEPHLGQVSENSSESPRSEHWGVLHFDEAGFHFANDARHVEPQSAALSIDAGASAGATDVLAGKAARYDINTVAPRSSVKSRNVRPNWERLEASIVLPLCQNLCCVGITFNRDDGAPSKEAPAEHSSTSACEKSQLIHSFLVVLMRACRCV